MSRSRQKSSSSIIREDDNRIQRLLTDYKEYKDSVLAVSAAPGPGGDADAAKRKTFFSAITNSPELQNVIFRFLSRDRTGHEEDTKVLFDLCDLLLAFYRFVSGSSQAKPATFTLASVAKEMERNRPVVIQYLPHLIAIYLLSLQRPEDKKQLKFIETFLLVIYNCETMDANNASPNPTLSKGDQNQPTAVSVEVAGLAKNSVYHDSTRLEMSSVEMERVGGVKLRTRPFDMVKSVNATTRPKILHLLLQVFNNHIMDVSKSIGLESFMKVMLKVLSRGHQQLSLRTSTRVRGQHNYPKINLGPPLLIEILLSAHHCIFNGLSTLGNQVTELIELKATANGWGDVLLVVNAMTNLTKNWSGDGTGRGLRAATTDAHYANSPGMQIAKHMITNASFRAKKISEDIPKVWEKPGEKDQRSKLMTNMKSITEDFGEEFPQLNKDMSALAAAAASCNQAAPITKTPTKGHHEGEKKSFNKEKFIAKLPNLKVGIHKKDRLSSADAVHGDSKDGSPSTNGNGNGGNGGVNQSGDARPQRSSVEHSKEELGLFAGGKKRGKDEKSGRGDKKSDDKSSKSDKKESKSEKSDKKDGKSDKKSEERNSKKRDKKKENNVVVEGASDQPLLDVASSGAIKSDGVDTLEKVEELIQMKRLPQETITIHSPESGTTIF